MPIFRHIAHHVTFFNLSWLQSELEEYEKCHSYDSDCYRKNVRARKICDSWGTEISDRFQATGAGEYASRPATPVPGVFGPYEWGFKSQVLGALSLITYNSRSK